MNKKNIIILIAVILILGLAVGGLIYWNKWEKARKGSGAIEKAGEATGKLIEGVNKGALPSVGANPLGSKPNINPADKANPFKDIKINPFD